MHDNYDIDQFVYLFKVVCELALDADLANCLLRVLVDYIRVCVFLIVDGVLLSNEGCGFVLCCILWRVICYGFQLGIEGTFFYKLLLVLVEEMG